MVSFFSDFSDLVSSVTTVAKHVGQEVVSDVRGAVQTAHEASRVEAQQQQQQQQQQGRNTSNDIHNNKGNKPSVPPASLDLHQIITDRLWCMPAPTVDAWTAKCYFDNQQQQHCSSSNNNNNNDGIVDDGVPFATPHDDNVHGRRNDVTVLAQYLEQYRRPTSGGYCMFHVSDTPPEDTVVRALKGRVVHLNWGSPSAPRSETPSLSAMLDIVYTIHAYLSISQQQHNHNNNNNIAIVCCANGKTRTALVVACYLAFARHQRTVQDGFVTFLLLQGTHLLLSDRSNNNNNSTNKMTLERAQSLWKACPPSLHTFGRNFDQTLSLGQYRNPKPLLLRAIALQGVPVEDKPCLDVWDGQQRHVYSSHPELWTDLVDTTTTTITTTSTNKNEVTEEEEEESEEDIIIPVAHQPPVPPPQTSAQQTPPQEDSTTSTTMPSLKQQAMQSPLPILETPSFPFSPTSPPPPPPPRRVAPHQNQNNNNNNHHQSSQWADEEGFYRVNVVLEGDFCILCRFGGPHANNNNNNNSGDDDDKDSTKVLFRYANTTTCMGAGGPYELPPSQVDLMRRYASCFDPDDFLCTLLFEAHWNNVADEPSSSMWWQDRLNRPCQWLPPVYGPNDVRALQRGWKLLRKHCVVQPGPEQVTTLLRNYYKETTTQDEKEEEDAAITTLPKITKHMAILALQQHDLNTEQALQSLQRIQQDPSSSMARLWQTLQAPSKPTPLLAQSNPQEEKEEEVEQPQRQDQQQPEEEPAALKEATQNILNILDSVDFGDEAEQYQPPKPDVNGPFSSFMRGNYQENASHQQRQQQQQQPPPASASYTTPFLNVPRQGDIINAFGEYYQDIHNQSRASCQNASLIDTSKPLVMGSSFPELPLQSAARLSNSRQRHPNHRLYSPVDDPANASSLELLLKMNHPGIALQDLTQLLHDSRHWNKPQPIPQPQPSKELEHKQGDNETTKQNDEGVIMAMGTAAGKAQTEGSTVVHGPAPPIKDHPEFSKYFKLLKSGKSMDDVKEIMKKDEKDPTIAELDPNQSLSSQRPNMAGQEVVYTTVNAVQNAQQALQDALAQKKEGPKTDIVVPKKEEAKGEGEEKLDTENAKANLMKALTKKKSAEENKEEDAPLRTDPVYSKYFKMLKMGMPKEQVQHAMTRDENDPTIIDLDPERSLKSQRTPEASPQSEVQETPLKDNPEYAKYFKMLKVGMPKEQVAHALQRDDKDPKILDMDPEKSLKSQQPESGGGDDGPPLKDDPDYAKYFKMLKMGMPKEQVAHALQRDDKDAKILDLDPEKSLKSQQADPGADSGPPLKEDEEYKKYFKMLKMGMAKEQVAHALQRDGKDTAVLDLDPNKSLASQQTGKAATVDDGPPLKEDPEYTKYFKMLNMGLPKDAVKNALQRDGKDPSIVDLDPEKSVKSQMGGAEEAKDDGPPLKEDPEYAKYFKMLSMGLPKAAVKNALQRDGKDPTIMDLDPEKSVKIQMGGGGEEEKDTGVPLKDDPEYTKYFKMQKMGLPKEAVKNALQRDGKDPTIMDLDPDKSVDFQLRMKSGGSVRRTPNKKKTKKVRRKKIFWTPLPPEQIKEDSIWNMVKGSVQMDKLNYDVKEFEDLFTESADPADRKKNKRKKTDTSKQKKSVQVIDGKRSMNGGIILARMKTDYRTIAGAVNEMQHRKFDATQLKALKEFLPTVDERQGLKMYMKKGESDAEVRDKLYQDLSECEKYMYIMIDVPKAAEKFDCMLFRNQFKIRFEDLIEALLTVDRACDETRNSEKLRKLMATILTLVNQINTGGGEEGKEAEGFSLDALLKLNEAKAFDKKTSVLMYLAKLVKKNDEELLGFQDDLKTVRHAENIVLDSLASDIKSIEAELEEVHKTAAEEAARLEAADELKPFSLSDLKELKTTVHMIDKVAHFNKVDHQSGRTPMERFALNTQEALRQANGKIESLKKKYAGLLEYFGEDDKMPSNEFFGVMRRFIEEFEKACDEVDKTEKDRIKQEKKEAKRIEQEKRKEEKVAEKKAARLASKPVLGKLAAKKAGLSEESGEAQVDSVRSTKTKPAGAGGIASLAALAASKKKQASNSGVDKDNSKGTSGSSIASLAALAASSKKKKTQDPENEGASSKGHSGAGGIAGLAAAAAAAQKKQGGSKEQAGEKSSSGASSLAAMAAASAKKKQGGGGQSSSGGKPTSAGSGLAAMAAAAAKKKQGGGEQTGTDSSSSGKPASGGFGLAAMAAAAAKKKQGDGEASGAESSNDADKTNTGSSGSIAGLAALAAQKKHDSSAESQVNTTKSTDDDGGGGGSIASLAALAAQKKQGGFNDSSVESPAGSGRADNSGGGGSIASLAALAAQKKQGGGLSSAKSPGKSDDGGGGGSIASLAALAAQKNQGDSADQQPTPEASESNTIGSSGGGLAAMARAAQSMKGARPTATNKAAPASRGISAAVSDTPRKRKVYDEESGLYHQHADTTQSSTSPLAKNFSPQSSDTLFQLGSSDGSHRSHGHGRLALPVRSKTSIAGFDRKHIRRQKSGGPMFRVSRSQSGSVASEREMSWSNSSFPPNQPHVGTEEGSNLAPAGTGITRSASHGDAETAGHRDRTGSSGSLGADFMSSLGFSPQESEASNNDDDNDEMRRTSSSPSVLFAMRRTQRKSRDEEGNIDDEPSTLARQSSQSSSKTIE